MLQVVQHMDVARYSNVQYYSSEIGEGRHSSPDANVGGRTPTDDGCNCGWCCFHCNKWRRLWY